MDIRVIKTEEDYQRALARIEQLMDAKPDTPEAEELELLCSLVHLYEKKHFPVDLPDPIAAIRFRMDQMGLRQGDLVPFIGSRTKVSEVLRGKRPLSLRMIRALHQGLGIPAEVLLQEPGEQIPENVEDIAWERFPLKEMVKRGWVEVGRKAALKDYAEDIVRRFLAPLASCGIDLGRLWCRQHVPKGSQMNRYSLVAWWVRVITLAQQQAVGPYRPGTIAEDFMQQLVRLSHLEQGPSLAQEFLAKSGIHMIVLRHLPGTYLDGGAAMLPSGHPLVALTLRYDRVDHFWFTLCHELGHVRLHLEKDKEQWFADNLEPFGGRAEQCEREADRFAEDSLVPRDVWEGAAARLRPTKEAVLQLAQKLQIDPAIIAGRIRREQGNYRLLASLVRRSVRKFFPRAEWGDVGCRVEAV